MRIAKREYVVGKDRNEDGVVAHLYRGPLVICASLKPFKHTDYPLDYYNEVARRMKQVECPLYALQYGIAECIVNVVGCIRTDHLRGHISRDHEFWGDFTDGDTGGYRYAFKLGSVHPIPHRIPVKGRQRFFDVEIPIEDCGEYA